MTSGIKYEREFKDRAVRLYAERRAEHQEESKAAALPHVAKIVGMPEDTLRTWTRRAEVDAGQRPGVTSDMAADLRRLRIYRAEPSTRDRLARSLCRITSPAVRAARARTPDLLVHEDEPSLAEFAHIRLTRRAKGALPCALG